MSCGINPYCYSPLSKGRIRLLRLMPYRDENAHIQCELFECPLLESGKGSHLYEALSYVWGSSETPRSISIDKRDLPVTVNLHEALSHLRDGFVERIIWRGHQVQYMARIYAKAIVWLGRAAADSDRAIKEILFTANKASTKAPNEEIKNQSIFALLQRKWARPSGLNTQTSPSGGFSLCILPLCTLIDMYHTHEATERHDKVYALLGMSSDDPSTTGLTPDYQISWEELFRRLIKFLLCERVHVEAWGDREVAVIKSKGCILAQVSSVESESVNITSKNTLSYLGQKREWSACWTLQASAKSIREGDLICLLEGASKPTIVRLCKDHFVIIMIAPTPTEDITDNGDIKWSDLLGSITTFPRDFLLVWDWKQSPRKLQDGKDSKVLIGSRVPKPSKTELEDCLDQAARL
ncbi:hypothetical protein K469DRAFT_741692 [Zopfia rhizophila CBS 207.26]|uniref:Heterokaryon incompatibility domain-containing protein n=1 Tax=Zopfia rhizophila CBS 207.26 TaxID=1314779 RepID=A0A6A6DLJ3_9PEZI|nr:hypothetical protein K469DRAFT_741692 [Zopfia rhizophila CBS 207.26]